MHKLVYCVKLKKEAEPLSEQPYPGVLGKRIVDAISAEAWGLWVAHQTMLINEHRLNMLDPDARSYLAREMEAFLFGDGSEKPAGYVPENLEK